MIYYIIGFTILSYLIGSFSSAYWFGQWFYNIDVRQYGSKNAGATNTLRVLGFKAAIPVFLVDTLKSFLSAKLVVFVPELPSGELYYQLELLFGMSAIVGHLFPLYTGFKGGKGVASMLGLVLALHPAAAGLAFAVFGIVIAISRIVSLSSMSAAIAFPIIMFILERNSSPTLTVFSIIAALLIIITHKKNIKRLIHREEKKISIGKQPKRDDKSL